MQPDPTRPMYERLCSLDDRSFMAKPFWQRVLKARESPEGTGPTGD